MENRVRDQFHGFLTSFPLWEGSGPFGIEQFTPPHFGLPLPDNSKILRDIPALSLNFVMGKRMESFFSYLIKSSSDFNLLAENLQIVEDKITLGEIDFIVENRTEHVCLHIELVFKFYVYDPAFPTEAERWIGPNRRDSLMRKVNRLKEHQFPLIYKDITKRILAPLNINNAELTQMVCFKALLFVPREMRDETFPLINNSCISGYWIHLTDFRLKEFGDLLFHAPKKPDWPVDPQVNEEWVSFQIIYQKVLNLHKDHISPLLWSKTSTGKIERFFVVWW